MRKATLTIVATLVMAILLAASATVAFAGATWEDCPPTSSQGVLHRSPTAAKNVVGLLPPEKANAKATSANPGNKYK